MEHRNRVMGTALLLGLMLFALVAQAQEPSEGSSSAPPTNKSDAAEIGAKLSNPVSDVSDVWALFSEFDLYFSDGDVNEGDPQIGGRMIFQPVLPFPL